MATEDNVRLLKHLDLLIPGALISLKGILNREVNSHSQPMERLLTDNRFRFNGIPREQFLQLFPTHSAVNTDIATWSISLLSSVVKVLFWSSLSARERSAINTLNLYLVDLRDNPDETSLMERDYITRRNDLRTALGDLSVSFENDTRIEVNAIIHRTGQADYDIKPAICRVRELCEFTNDMMHALEQRFAELYPQQRKSRSAHLSGMTDRSDEESATNAVQFPNKLQLTETDKRGKESFTNVLQLPNEVPLTETDRSDERPVTIVVQLSNEVPLIETDRSDERPVTNVVQLPVPVIATHTHEGGEGPVTSVVQLPSEVQLITDDDVTSPNTQTFQDEDTLNNIEGVAIRSPGQSQNEERISTIVGELWELHSLYSRAKDKREFWQGIDIKIDVSGDTASHAVEAETAMIMMVNKTITEVDLAEPLGRRQHSESELENLSMISNSSIGDNMSGEIDDAPGQEQNAINTIAHESSDRSEEATVIVSARSILTEILNLPLLPTSGDIIEQRVRSMMQRDDYQFELLEALLPLLLDIMNLGDITIMCAGTGCVLLEIRCKTYSGMANLLKYIGSDRFQLVLNGIAMALGRQTGRPVTLTPFIPDESLNSLEMFVADEFRFTSKEASLLLQLKYESIIDLLRIVKLLGTDRVKAHLRNVSKVLAQMTGGSITLKTALDPVQYKHALENRTDMLLYTATDIPRNNRHNDLVF